MKKYNLGIPCLFVALALQGCASSPAHKLDEKLGQEQAVTTRTELRAEASQAIENAQGLTPEQRQALTSLKSTAGAQIDQCSQQALKLRAILVKDLISTHYDMDEVNLIKARLSDLEDRRLTVIFDAIAKANTIMGRQAALNQPIFRDFIEPRGGSSRD